MGKRTPGIWSFGNHLCGDGMRVFVQHESDLDQHDAICDLETWQTEEETRANAALIAAAPDLLEASKVALSCLEYRAEQTNRKWTVADQNAFDKLKKAISKAEGRTE